jgi:pyruvate/2-oxoglutarate dehydrogenase complex dihydrolipoamide acyltransferase (E2) component
MKFTGDGTRAAYCHAGRLAEHMVMSRKTSAHVTTFLKSIAQHILKAKEKQQAEFERDGVR